MKIDIWKIFLSVLKTLFDIIKILVMPILAILLIIGFMCLVYLFYFIVIKKMKKERPYYEKYYEPSVFYKIFVQFPKQLTYDYITKNPYDFNEFGIHLICGGQGSGKTMTAVYLLNKWHKIYPKLKIYSNSELTFQNGDLIHWKQLLTRNNGTYGVVNFIDEIHTWFSNMESKDLPPEVLGEISQQRKQRKAILGTAQVFGKVAKPLREQTHYVYRPFTFFGCITFVFMSDAHSYDSDKDKFKKTKGFFFFVHTKELRDSYDTYKRISRYKNVKFARSLIGGTSENESSEVHQ